jgi:hypothetical protein
MRNFTRINVGDRFTKLVALERSGRKTPDNKIFYRYFKCDCGKIKEIMEYSVKSGHTKCCGCINREFWRKKWTTHNMSRSRIYTIWNNMKMRCSNKNDTHYKYYGGRGITVCRNWLTFIGFYNWAKNSGYKQNLTIDRIDNNKGYYPDNCRWSTVTEQNRNKSNLVKYKGEFAAQASVRLGGKPCLIYGRLKRGWSIKKAFTTDIILG